VERDTCLPYVTEELEYLHPIRVMICLGGFAWAAAARLFGVRPMPKFGHGAEFPLPDGGPVLLGCFHPSQQNTFTGRLTPAMVEAVLADAKQIAGL
jgi:uracil-DNA glycosylase